ncbi:hypothetical protein [Actinomadura sp. NTSP31]|uniref:hypothetical protein n=1 Tax=Actinomadura sp. NTSP31 TaxID=1735447 RepID=UPI0035C138E2
MNDLGYTPKVAHPRDVGMKIDAYSTSLRRAAGLPKGKVGPHGALIDLDAQGVKRGFRMHDTWSIYGLPDVETGQGFDRIVAALPANGWKIVKRGESSIRKGSPEVWAEHTSDHATITIEWWHADGDKSAQLLGTVDSIIYIAPEDVDLNTFY